MPYFGFNSGYRPFCSYWWKHHLRLSTYTNPFKWFFQRGLRGYAECDHWSLDNYLNDVIPGLVRDLKTHLHSFPHEMTVPEWEGILEEIASGFEAGNLIDDCFDPKKEKELLAKFDRGMELFVNYYRNLWD
jgi:hypothetical protein